MFGRRGCSLLLLCHGYSVVTRVAASAVSSSSVSLPLYSCKASTQILESCGCTYFRNLTDRAWAPPHPTQRDRWWCVQLKIISPSGRHRALRNRVASPRLFPHLSPHLSPLPFLPPRFHPETLRLSLSTNLPLRSFPLLPEEEDFPLSPLFFFLFFLQKWRRIRAIPRPSSSSSSSFPQAWLLQAPSSSQVIPPHPPFLLCHHKLGR